MRLKEWQKVIITISLMGALVCPLGASAESASFPDVDGTNPYAVYIFKLQQEGVINGIGDGTFAPHDAVTRAEFLKMAVVGFQLPLDHGASHFTDMDSHWAAQYVQTAWNQGIIKGTNEKRFSPDTPITREEAAVIVWRLLQAKGIKPSVITFMLTNNVDDWARAGVSQCVAKKLFGVPFSSGTFQDALSREEAAALIDLSMKLNQE